MVRRLIFEAGDETGLRCQFVTEAEHLLDGKGSRSLPSQQRVVRKCEVINYDDARQATRAPSDIPRKTP
jgi:hypothetical protein